MATNTNISEQKALSRDGLLYFWQGVKGKLAEKVDKVEGKGLSTNDFTDAEKAKLAAIAEGATKIVVEDVLTSTSTANALSANQGRVLAERIQEAFDSMGELGYGDMMKSTYDADGDGKVDKALNADEAAHAVSADEAANAVKFGGQEPAYYAKASDIPTQVGQLQNDAGYITIAAVPTKVGALENDAGFITQAAIPTKVSAFENDKGYLTEHQDISGKLDKTGDGSAVTATFTPASERANIATGEKLNVIFGKIAKYLSDLKAVAFSGSYEDLTHKPSIPVVTNDLTNELKAQYDAAYNHSQVAHAPADAQANVIETINVNGTAVAPSGKAVSLTIPTTVAQLTDAGNYALKSDLTNVYQYAGSVANFAALPTGLGAVAGTVPVYNVEDTGMNYAWNGSNWDNLGTVFTIDYMTNADIDAILAS